MKEMKEDLRQAIEGGIDRATIESIVAEVLDEQGRKDVSPGAFCERNLADWNKILTLKSITTNLRREVRMLIETSIAMLPPPSPITTLEMIATLGIPQGPFVRKLVLERDRLLRSGILDRQELLAKLAYYFQTLQLPSPSGPPHET